VDIKEPTKDLIQGLIILHEMNAEFYINEIIDLHDLIRKNRTCIKNLKKALKQKKKGKSIDIELLTGVVNLKPNV